MSSEQPLPKQSEAQDGSGVWEARKRGASPRALPPPPQAAPLRRRRKQAVDPNAVPPSSQPAAVGFWQEATAAARWARGRRSVSPPPPQSWHPCGGGGNRSWAQTPRRRVPRLRPWASGRKLRPQLGGTGFCSNRQACSSADPRFPASAHAFRGPLSLGTPLQHRTCARGEGGPGCPGQRGRPRARGLCAE